jgi:hypothetical protein
MKKIGTLAFIAFVSVAPEAFADRKVSHQFKSSLAAADVKRIVIEVPVAELTVRTAAGSDVTIEGVATRDVDNDKEAREAQPIVDNSSIVMKSRGRTAYIEPEYRGVANGWMKKKKTAFRVTITVPPGLPVDIDQEVGDVEISGATGDMNLRLGVGEVHVTMPKHSVRELSASATIGEVKTNFPDRTITKEGFFAGTTHYLNEGGKSNINLRVRVGEMKIDLVD